MSKLSELVAWLTEIASPGYLDECGNSPSGAVKAFAKLFAGKLEALIPDIESEHQAEIAAVVEQCAQEADKQARMATAISGHCNCNTVVADRIRKLRTTAQISALEAVKVRVRLEEACTWYNHCHFKSPKTGNTHMAEIMEIFVENRVAELRAASEESK